MYLIVTHLGLNSESTICILMSAKIIQSLATITLQCVKKSCQLIVRLEYRKLVLSPSLLYRFRIPKRFSLSYQSRLSDLRLSPIQNSGKPAPDASITSLPPLFAMIKAIRDRAQSYHATRCK